MNAIDPTSPTTPKLDIGGLEAVYDALATAIDAAGSKSELMLVKLALLHARDTGEEAFLRHLESAARDL
ncbi:DUF2783 domain-containing protein [Variovorax sp. VNK109]|uniref:DUF2783 domain-containing protein n=1 Tax=Variovorax sp. VNK109 TaxID=3400919 RepID=UPI003BFC7EAE